MNRELQEDYEYHQNAKWDYNEELKKEHHDPESFREEEDEPMDEETTKLWQVRTNLQLLYGNSNFEYSKPLIKSTIDILDGLIDVKKNE